MSAALSPELVALILFGSLRMGQGMRHPVYMREGKIPCGNILLPFP